MKKLKIILAMLMLSAINVVASNGITNFDESLNIFGEMPRYGTISSSEPLITASSTNALWQATTNLNTISTNSLWKQTTNLFQVTKTNLQAETTIATNSIWQQTTNLATTSTNTLSVSSSLAF